MVVQWLVGNNERAEATSGVPGPGREERKIPGLLVGNSRSAADVSKRIEEEGKVSARVSL